MCPEAISRTFLIKRDLDDIPTNRSRRTWHKAATPLSSGVTHHRYSINSYQTGRSVYLWSFPKFCREEATHHMWRPTQVRNCPFSTRLPTRHGRTPHLHRVVCKVQTICSRPHDPTCLEECPPIHRMDVGSEDSGGGVSR